MTEFERTLITRGVKNLREFGYPACDSANILTDPIYSQFFASMLRENKGFSAGFDLAIDGLLKRIEQPAPVAAVRQRRKKAV